MKRSAQLAARSGSVLVFILSVSLLLLIVGIYFGRNMIFRRAQSYRQEGRFLSGTFADSVAHLVRQRLQFGLRGTGDVERKVAENLIQPFSSMQGFGDREWKPGTGDSEIQKILESLEKVLENQGKFSWKACVSMKKEDFAGLSKEFPGEKSGCVRLRVETEFRGQSDEFRYLLPVKVALTAVPILSKFTLFVDDAGGGGDNTLRYNLVSNDIDGKVTQSPFPLVLNNGMRFPGEIPSSGIRWDTFFSKRIGLVYLGGGDLDLNLAMGLLEGSRENEGFHLYRDSRPERRDGKIFKVPFFVWREEDYADPRWCDPPLDGKIQFERWETGMADVAFDSLMKKNIVWELGDLFKHRKDNERKKSSIFRLMGNEGCKSPTIVFGRVFKQILCVSAYRVTSDRSKTALFRYPGSGEFSWQNMWNRRASVGLETLPALRFHYKLDPPAPMDKLDHFRDIFASDVRGAPYNQALGFMAGDNLQADPLAALGGDKLKDVIVGSSQTLSDTDRDEVQGARKLPDELKGLSPAGAKGGEGFPRIGDLLGGMDVQKVRAAWNIRLSQPGDLEKELTRRGLLRTDEKGKSLDPNGWIIVSDGSEKALNLSLPEAKILSNGGLFLEKGSWTIGGNLESVEAGKNAGAGNPWAFQVVTGQGDIDIRQATAVDAGLVTAKGMVSFKDAGTGLTIRGGLATERYDLENKQKAANLVYNPRFAALPPRIPDEETLGISFAPNPIPVRE